MNDATASTYCIFGWNGNQGIEIKEITVSKEMPPVHAVDKRPYLKPLHDLLKIDYEVLLIIMDHKSAILKQFRGSKLVQESKLGTYLKNKHSKGGSSQARFARNREIQIDQFLKKINV